MTAQCQAQHSLIADKFQAYFIARKVRRNYFPHVSTVIWPSPHLSLAGLLSHLDRKNAEQIAALVDVERLVMQDCIGTAPWDHWPLIEVLVGQVVDRLGDR